MRVGILGCGYVGKALANKWQQIGYSVSVTTRKPERTAELQAISDQVFLLPHSLKPFLQSQEVIVISVAPSRQEDYASTYLRVAEEVVQLLPEAPNLKHLIYLSSTSVYGEHNGEWVDETTPVNPLNANAEILCQTEEKLLSFPHSCIFRLGEIYGPDREITERLRRMQGQPFPGTGGNFTNLIHLEDIIEAIHFALIHHLTGIYNLCNDLHIPRKELYAQLCHEAGLPSVKWEASLKSIHGGNKKVSNQKMKNAGFDFDCKYTK